MKHRGLLCILILLLSLHSIRAARLFKSTQPADLSGIHQANNGVSAKGAREGITKDNPWELMGMEECNKGDEECEQRRVLSEAHLDYIYTQGHHKKP